MGSRFCRELAAPDSKCRVYRTLFSASLPGHCSMTSGTRRRLEFSCSVRVGWRTCNPITTRAVCKTNLLLAPALRADQSVTSGNLLACSARRLGQDRAAQRDQKYPIVARGISHTKEPKVEKPPSHSGIPQGLAQEWGSEIAHVETITARYQGGRPDIARLSAVDCAFAEAMTAELRANNFDGLRQPPQDVKMMQAAALAIAARRWMKFSGRSIIASAGAQDGSHCKTEPLRSFEVDNQLKPGGLLHGQLGALGPIQNLIDKRGGSLEPNHNFRPRRSRSVFLTKGGSDASAFRCPHRVR